MVFERITVNPDVMGGMPTIRGLRIPVATLVAMIADRMSPAEIVAELPDLTEEDVAEALRYAAEAMRERELPLLHARMKLLLDENLSPVLAGFLREAGHDVAHVRDIGLTSAPDESVMAAAASEGRILVSADADFGTLLARTGASVPSIVLLRRTSGRRADEQAALLVDNLPAVAEDLSAGAVVVLGQRTMRIRRLPI